MPTSRQRARQLRAQLIGFAVSALVALVIFGTTAWWWTSTRETALPDGDLYQNGKIVGRAVGVRSDRAGQVHFAEIADADALLKLGKFQYGASTLSINTIQIVHYPQSGSGVRLVRVTARPDQN
jgi:hypothetical protein